MLGLLFVVMAAPGTRAEPPETPARTLKELTLEELFDLEVTSVSRRAENLAQAASAIQVIPGEDLRRSGATTLAEALRLASNLQVAQVSAHHWATSPRGFSGAPLSTVSLANKLLVLIDGRSVYTPLFGGVFWDVQHVLLEDVDRIEVISGPGGTLWGANAVNGVVNVVTRSATETQGVYVGAAAGSWLRDAGALRWGGPIGDDGGYRVYLQRLDFESSLRPDGTSAHDEWGFTQGGFRADVVAGEREEITIQGDVYGAALNDPISSRGDGENLLARWTRSGERSNLSVQAYVDRARRTLPGGFEEDLRTVDTELQHRLPLFADHSLLWGAGARLILDDVSRSTVQQFDPDEKTLRLFSAFVQDDIALVPGRINASIGTKFEHNSYSGLEVQPSARISWLVTPRHTLWGAVSRAVRSPSRFDADVVIPLAGDPDFESETVIASELGLRLRAMDRMSLSIATFYNDYDDVRSINVVAGAPPTFRFANDQEAWTAGVELSGLIQTAPWMRLRAGYTYFRSEFRTEDPSVLAGSDRFEGIDPRHQALLHASFDLPQRSTLDVLARYVDALPASLVTPAVPAYTEVDARLAKRLGGAELAVVGRNLAAPDHIEFGSLAIPRSVHGSVAWRF